MGPYTEADAHRIVDCVNACKDINPEAVPAMLALLKDGVERLESMRFTQGLGGGDEKWIADARAVIALADKKG